MRGRSWSLLGHDGRSRREGSFEVTIALPSAKFSPRSSSVRGALVRSPGDKFDVVLDEQQLRAGGELGSPWNATWNGYYAASPGWYRARMGPVSRPVSPAATR